jgi:WhiB family redox-sensing transcriptional regulator
MRTETIHSLRRKTEPSQEEKDKQIKKELSGFENLVRFPLLPKAACKEVDPEIFQPIGETYPDEQLAKEICLGCEERTECLIFSFENNEKFGIWGGLTHQERRALKTSAK